MVRPRFVPLLVLSLSLTGVPLARAANWATTVIQYSPGTIFTPPPYFGAPGAINVAYSNYPTADVLNGLTADTTYGILTPFNAVFDAGQMVGVGAGGSLTLQFSTPVRTNGFTIGIHTGIGLNDSDYPNGTTGTPATIYNDYGHFANIEVSANGTSWTSLGGFDLNNPSNFYATGITTPDHQTSDPGGIPADVEKPFLGNLASFDNKAWPDILTLLDGSAGGNWIDLSGSGLPAVSYIRFTEPAGSILYVDGVVGLSAPEPASLGVMIIGATALLARRRRA